MKNKKAITRMILKGILLGGAIVVASTSPYFVSRVLPRLLKYGAHKSKNKNQKKEVYDIFYQLKNRNLIQFEQRGKQIYINLTEEGKRKAGKYQIDNLEIKKPKKWDAKWRILIFDIKDREKIKREALRGKIKEMGLFQLQKSVWVCPYDFQKEADILRSFFGLKKEEMQMITASEIEDDRKAKTFFKIK